MRQKDDAVQVRRIHAAEWQPLRDLRLRALASDPTAFGSSYADQRAFPATYWQERATRGATSSVHAMFVACDEQTWFGMLGAFLDETARDVELVSMWVAPEVRRQGVARDLMHTALDWSACAGARQAMLWVTSINEPALALYRRLGFVATGATQEHPTLAFLHEVQMRRDGLAPSS